MWYILASPFVTGEIMHKNRDTVMKNIQASPNNIRLLSLKIEFFILLIKFRKLQNINLGDIMQNFSEYANTLRRKMKFSKEETIFVCIGSNKVVWDSIGPYVGSILKEKIGEKYVIGDLENNICSQKDLKSYYPIVKN